MLGHLFERHKWKHHHCCKDQEGKLHLHEKYKIYPIMRKDAFTTSDVNFDHPTLEFRATK